MATHRLQMTLSTDSIKKVAKELGKIGRGANMKAWKAARLSAEGIAEFISMQYTVPNTGYVGDINVNVRVNQIDKRKGYRVVASGPDIYFLEFGTGKWAAKPEDVPSYYSKVTVLTGPGSYSTTVGHNQFIPGVKEYWFWRGQKTDGSLPAFAFSNAYSISPLIIRSAIQEAFK